jgi:hypothetical protein
MSDLGLFEGLKGEESLGDLQKKEEKENKEKKEKVDKTRIVCYAGHKIYIEDRTLSLEDIRKQLEKDFPELTKKRTTMEYDEKTGIIVPVIKAKKNGGYFKGYYTSLEEMAKAPRPVNIVMGRDGLYEIRETPFGVFCVKKEKVDELNVIKEQFLPKIPTKIPMHLLQQAVTFFERWASMKLEAEAQFFWDDEKRQYFVYIPEQKVTSYSVEIQRNLELEERFVLAAEIHSHHFMPPIFSSTDNMEEKRTGIYGVVGNFGNKRELEMRYSCGGEYRPLDPRIVFQDFKRDKLDVFAPYPREWDRKITVLERGNCLCR